jgi:hypothetical protein
MYEVNTNSFIILVQQVLLFISSYLANSSLSRRTNSSAVHWSERLVKPHISANRMLIATDNLIIKVEKTKIMKIYNIIRYTSSMYNSYQKYPYGRENLLRKHFLELQQEPLGFVEFFTCWQSLCFFLSRDFY